jgi:hypothetical protein
VAIFRLESGQVRLLRHTEDGSSVVMHMARPVRRLPRRPCSPTPITATPSPRPHRRLR